MHASPTRATQATLLLGFLALASLLAALPLGSMAPMGTTQVDPATGERVFVHDHARMTRHGLANALGSFAVLLTAAALATGYVPWTRRLHAPLGVAVLALALGHTLLYVVDGSLRGWLPGAGSLVAYAFHGATGAWKAPFLRAWGPGWWRFAHRGSAWAALLLTAEHVLLASWHWGLARWLDP